MIPEWLRIRRGPQQNTADQAQWTKCPKCGTMLYRPDHVDPGALRALRAAGAAAVKVFLAYPELGIMWSADGLSAHLHQTNDRNHHACEPKPAGEHVGKFFPKHHCPDTKSDEQRQAAIKQY